VMPAGDGKGAHQGHFQAKHRGGNNRHSCQLPQGRLVRWRGAVT
jgi:hypothetical protein